MTQESSGRTKLALNKQPKDIITVYRTRAIITRGLYTFYPLFEVHLCTLTFGLMYGQYSRAGYSGARTVAMKFSFYVGLKNGIGNANCPFWFVSY